MVAPEFEFDSDLDTSLGGACNTCMLAHAELVVSTKSWTSIAALHGKVTSKAAALVTPLSTLDFLLLKLMFQTLGGPEGPGP
jgi:hypothetical protein